MGWIRALVLRVYGKSEDEVHKEIQDQRDRIEARRADRLEYLLALKQSVEAAESQALARGNGRTTSEDK